MTHRLRWRKPVSYCGTAEAGGSDRYILVYHWSCHLELSNYCAVDAEAIVATATSVIQSQCESKKKNRTGRVAIMLRVFWSSHGMVANCYGCGCKFGCGSC